MSTDKILRDQLLYLLGGGGAHPDFDAAVARLPAGLRGVRPVHIPYSPWELVEHMRIAQWDILEFCRNPDYVSPDWPSGYWPGEQAPPERSAWSRSIRAFRADLKAMQELVADADTELCVPIPHGQGQTILREALLVADHNAYHLGQLIVVRRALGAWKG